MPETPSLLLAPKDSSDFVLGPCPGKLRTQCKLSQLSGLGKALKHLLNYNLQASVPGNIELRAERDTSVSVLQEQNVGLLAVT